MSLQPFLLKNVKQKLTRQLNALNGLLFEAQEFEEPWRFPTQAQELEMFLISKEIVVKNLMSQLEQRKNDISDYYAECNQSINDILEEEVKADIEQQFDEYWQGKRGEELLSQAEDFKRKLERRLVELLCQETSAKQEFKREPQQGSSNQSHSPQILDQSTTPGNVRMLEHRLLGNELRVPNFYGNPSTFNSFWELFEELVHKQPYSNIEKLSILINCCKGDAARTLQMIPRTGESYDKAIAQLKSQYQDPRRIIMQMIKKLKSMKQCPDDYRSLRNNLNDIQAIIATLEKQGEVVNTTNMRTMVLETFSKKIQDEMAKKEFDSGGLWSMTNLLDNLSTAIRRKEHVDSIRDPVQGEPQIFSTNVTVVSNLRCTGCGQQHKFQYCNKYSSITQKIARLRELHACWKCFSPKHQTQFCRKQNCTQCGRPHNPLLCRQIQQDRKGGPWDSNHKRFRSLYPLPQKYWPGSTRQKCYSPRRPVQSRSYSPNNSFNRRKDLTPSRYDKSPQRVSPQPSSRRPGEKITPEREHSPLQNQQRQVRFHHSPKPRRRSSESVTVNLQVQERQIEDNNDIEDRFTDTFTNSSAVRLMMVPVQLQTDHDQKKTTVIALLDSASDQSFITTSLAHTLNLNIKSEATIIVNTFGGKAEKRKTKRVITSLFNAEGDFINVELLTNDQITPPLQMGSVLREDELFIREHLSEDEVLRLLEMNNDTVIPGILIGMDYFNSVMQLDEPVLRLPSGLLLTHTFFGPVISGAPQFDHGQHERSYFSKRVINSCTILDSNGNQIDISDLWKLHTIGIEDMTSDEEINNQIIADFYSKVQVKDNSIFVCFPWKPNKMRLANNYTLALSRLHQLFKMKERNPQCWKEYCTIIEDQLKKKFIEEAPRFPTGSNTPCYYIPHQAVIKSEKATTKTRIVLDASSKKKGELSLNDVIHQGPLILPNLCGVLIRSRIGSKIMIADVEKAFHMIHLQETERDAVRFLWLKNTSQPPTPDNLQILRFCRLPFGINASPFLLGISIRYGIEKQSNLDKDFQIQLNDNLYVDNVLLTDDSTQSLLRKCQLSKQIFNNMAMNLRQFITNDDICNQSIQPSDLSNTNSIKILGIPWNHKTDILSITCKLKHSSTLTKRKVLQLTHSTFDPLGWLIPLLLKAKLFLQDLWKHKYNWDESLSSPLTETWKTIYEQAAGFVCSIPRVIATFTIKHHCELMTFVDASIRSFAAAVYLRTINSDEAIRSTLVMARQRPAPLNQQAKTVTIPRLELLALLIGIRLANFVLKEVRLALKEIYVFSDSQVVLSWVQSKTKMGTFVDNRCQEIRKKMQEWTDNGILCHLLYIPSELNPADCATKGLTREQLKNHIWWTGPPFLLKPRSQWPDLPEFSWKIEDNTQNSSAESNLTVLTMKSAKEQQSPILFESKFSSIRKLKRTVTLVLKFLKSAIYNKISIKNKEILKNALPEIAHMTESRPLTSIQSLDLSQAEKLMIRYAQKTIRTQRSTKLHNLQLYTDPNGIIRCRGRIQAKHLAEETREPILLPEDHHLTALLIEDIHRRCGHQSVNGTLANLRLNYWIPKGRQQVKKCLRACLTCKKWNSKPYFYPNSPPLPQSRTQPSRPFLHVGIELAGPFQVIVGENAEQKKWILLLTCMVTRAVHLEIVNNLSAVEFLNGLRRFVARRGKPALIISDNATNFTSGCEILKASSNELEASKQHIQNSLSNEGIKWKFLTPLSPWKGGFYERMIGIMKSILKKTSRRKAIHEYEFATVVPECEAMVNTRPLTYSGSTVDDSVVLRPIDFIIPYANVNLLPSTETDSEDPDYCPFISSRAETTQLFQRHTRYLNNLWKFWTVNYLLELRSFHQTRIKQKSFTRKQPHVGEVVLIMEENTPRGEWPLGLVTKLIQDQDGYVRSVDLKTAKSNITRSINLLIPLEVEDNQCNNNDNESMDTPQACANSSKKHCETSAPQSNNMNNMTNRTRPWLPRRAKEQKSYRVNAIQLQDNSAHASRSSLNWQGLLMLTLFASLCGNAHSRMNTKNEHDVIQCTKGGVIIRTYGQPDRMQVCANDYCIEIQNPDKLITAQFPAEITLHTYHVLVKTLLDNSTHAFHWACSPSPFCEQIQCTLCSQMITNPECWPRLAIVLTAALFYTTLITIYLLCQTVRKISRGMRTIKNIFTAAKNSCPFQRRPRRNSSTQSIPLIQINNENNKRWKSSTFIRLLAICAISQQLHACQQVILVPSSISQCNSRTHNCDNITTIIAKFNTMQTELCLQAEHKNLRRHLMKITVEKLILKCQKETLYFTQNTETHVQSRKRCPHMGSCIGSKCTAISPDTLVKELDVANNFPGITYCTESCGGWGCSCGFPSSGCLFYRIYHTPKDKEIYEVFHCPTWHETVKLKIEQTHTHDAHRVFTGEIKPYTIRTLANTKIEVTSFSSSSIAIQYKRFLTNNKTTAYLDDDATFSYACTNNPSPLNNSTSTCAIKDTCKCNPAEDSISCYCMHNDVSHLRHLPNVLPLPIPNGVIIAGPKQIPQIHTSTFASELAIHLDPTSFQIEQLIVDFYCTIIPISFGGCYDCYKGAEAKISCAADVQHAIAQATCGTQQFVLTCTRQGKTNQIRLFFNSARIKEQCQAQCGSQTMIFELKGTLNYITGLRPLWNYTKQWNNTIQDDYTFDLSLNLPDFHHFLAICKAFFLFTVTVLIIMPFLMAISIAYLCSSTTKTSTPASRSSTPTFLLPFPMSLACSLLILIFKRLFLLVSYTIRLPFMFVKFLMHKLLQLSTFTVFIN
ncbi:unnamed protein product [Haemonchus placei]|uniref:Integrase catalytic domain-containing protein n=1 Tax=Haemonchus placei TaxID=6290 RepID=A0A0N4VSW9_HAEPC|nr:unnamed protein product [Haemonchus placei]